MKKLHTEIVIAASAERVWKELVDFAAYPQWNPLVKEASGELVEGKRLRVRLVAGKREMKVSPKLLKVVPNRELRWRGTLPIPGIFAGEHAFEILPADVGVRFHQWEEFSGLLVPFMVKFIDGDTKRGFEAMNAALKARCEAAATASNT